MLKLASEKRSSVVVVTTNLCINTINVFSERLLSLYISFEFNIDAVVEKARFMSWILSQDIDFYCRSTKITFINKMFDFVIENLRQLKTELKSLNKNHVKMNDWAFLKIRTLNIQLLNLLSFERVFISRFQLQSFLFTILNSEKFETKFSNNTFFIIYSQIAQKSKMRTLIAQIKTSTTFSIQSVFIVIFKSIMNLQEIERFTVDKIRDDNMKKFVIIENVKYQDFIRRERFLFRIHALCNLISSKNIERDLRLFSFYELYEDSNKLCFDIVYEFPHKSFQNYDFFKVVSLHDLLIEQVESIYFSWKNRCILTRDLAKSLIAIHEVDWYHKDLTSFNILFFSTDNISQCARVNSFYLLDFHHNRSVIDDFTKDSLQNWKHQRYHHSLYISVQDYQYTRFCSEFDHYNLNILLIKIALWVIIDTIMKKHNALSNHEFFETLIQQKFFSVTF